MTSEEGGRRDRGPFGPLEALDEVQRQAFEAALRVTAELSALSGGLAEAAWLPRPEGGPRGRGHDLGPPLDVGRLRSDVAKATDTFADLLRALLDVGFDAVDELARRGGTHPTGRAGPGSVALLTCTVRNGADERHDLRPHVPQLANSSGRVLQADIEIVPPALELAPHQRATIEVRVAVPPDAEAGTYHGLLLVGGLPDAVHPVTVEVADDRD